MLYKATWISVTAPTLHLSSFEKATRNWRRIQLFGSETGIAPKALQTVLLQLYHGAVSRDLKHHDGSHDDGIPEANFLLRSCAETE